MAKAKAKHIMVMMKSMVTGHSFNFIRPRLAEKVEILRYDPYLGQDSVYKESHKVRSIRATIKENTDRKFKRQWIIA